MDTVRAGGVRCKRSRWAVLFDTEVGRLSDEEWCDVVAESRELAVAIAARRAPDLDAQDVASELMLYLLRYRRSRSLAYRFSCVFHLSLANVVWHMRKKRRAAHKWGGRPLADYAERVVKAVA